MVAHGREREEVAFLVPVRLAVAPQAKRPDASASSE